MKDEDTVEEQPVEESLEDEISNLLDAANEEGNDEKAEDSDESDSQSPDEKDQPEESESDLPEGDETTEPDTDNAEDSEEPESADDDGEDDDAEEPIAAEAEKLEAPQHWSAADQEIFSEQPKEAQEFILRRHKEMEGDYTRKSQEVADTKRQFDAIRDALAPYEQDFARAGLDHAGAVRQLAQWDTAIKTRGKAAILELATTYGVDLSEPDIDDDATDPALRQTRQELAEIKTRLARNDEAAQQTQQEALLSEIQQFEEAKDADGKLLHPHFLTLKDDITRLFTAGMSTDLEDGYKKALTFHPELTAPAAKPKAVSKANQAEKVKKAKKAATGIRSSGAVGKQTKELSLHDEIASLMN